MVDTTKIHVFGDSTCNVWTAPLGTAYPTSPLPTAWGAGWQPLGWLSDAGIVLSQAMQETKVYGYQGAGMVRDIRTQLEKRFAFTALEWNAVTLGLTFPGTSVTSTGFTAEVQTITITGSPTGGTFTITVAGYGSYVAAYNVPTATLATALTTLLGATVTVTGTAGTSYVITFPSSAGDIALSSVTSAVTGGTSPTVTIATTTPGVTGVNTRNVVNYTGQNLRMFGIDIVDGSRHLRAVAPNAEAVSSGDIPLTGTALATLPMTTYCYPDANGSPLYIYDDFPGTGSGLFT